MPVNSYFSIHAKAAEMSYIKLIAQKSDNSTSSHVNFNLANGTVHDTKNATGEIISLGNGWYRCIMKDNSIVGGFAVIEPNTGATSGLTNISRETYAGNASDGLFVWGMMLADAESDYVKTEATATGGPRYSHDPETLVPTGLYLEPAATNLVQQNTTLSNWVKNNVNVSIDNNITNPDGSTGAAKISTNSTPNTTKFIQASGITGSGTVVSFSGYFKYANHQYVDVYGAYNHFMTNSARIRLDLINGTVTTSHGYYATLTSLPNGWFYLRANGSRPNSSTAASPFYIWFIEEANSGSVSAVLAPLKEVYVWGLQTELSNYPSSTIINNTTSSMTRAADTYTSTATTVFDRDGGNKEAFWSPTANTMFGQMKYNEQTEYPRLYEFTSPNGETMTIFIDHNNDQLNGRMTTQAALQYNIITGSAQDNTLVKLANTYQLNDAMVAIDGSLGTQDTSVALHVLPTDGKRPLSVNIGDRIGGDRHTNAPIQRITHWKTRLPDASLINITNT